MSGGGNDSAAVFKWEDKMIACVHTLCYTASKGGDDLEKKKNSEIVKDYHEKLVEIKVRFPSEKQCGYDYPSLIRARAKELGIINVKGKDKGEGSANAYILHLIEKDLGIEVKTISGIDK